MYPTEAPQHLGGMLIAAADLQKGTFAELVGRSGLTPPQARAVLELAEPRSMRSLAASLTCDASNVTVLADQLEDLGLVRRVPGADRRVKNLTLTSDGQARRHELAEHLSSGPFPTDRLSTAERRQLGRLLRTVLGDHPGGHAH